MIGAAPFCTLAQQAGAQVFSVQIEEVLKGPAAKAEVNEVEIKRLLPQEYHDLVDVFPKSAADQLLSTAPLTTVSSPKRMWTQHS